VIADDLQRALELARKWPTVDRTEGVWQIGTAGDCNVVAFDGDDIAGVAARVTERNTAAMCFAVNNMDTLSRTLLHLASQHAAVMVAVEAVAMAATAYFNAQPARRHFPVADREGTTLVGALDALSALAPSSKEPT
jgi:hypothetical protein